MRLPSWSGRRLPRLVLICLTFFGLALLRPLSEADAAIFAVVAALVFRDYRPHILVLIASVQDGPGIAYIWHYVSFGLVAAITVGTHVLRQLLGSATQRLGGLSADGSTRTPLMLATLGAVVAAYGTFASFAHDRFSGRPQTPDKPYYLAGLLMLVMIVVGYVAARECLTDARRRRHLVIVCTFCIAHSVAIAGVQAVVGPEFYRSSGKQVIEADQLVEPQALGLPRLSGPFLNPNTLALSTGLLLVLIVAAHGGATIRLSSAMLYAVVAAGLSLLTLSKAMTAYFIVATLITLRAARSRAALIALCALVTPALAYVVASYLDLLSLAFRYRGADVGARALAWGAVVDGFTLHDWLFGVGITHWETFLSGHVGLSLSDPHTMTLSVPGGFGVLGVLFYIVLLGCLVQVCLARRVTGMRRSAALMMGAMLFGRDLATIQTVFGNTPMTFLVWTIIGLVLAERPVAASAPAVTPAPAESMSARLGAPHVA